MKKDLIFVEEYLIELWLDTLKRKVLMYFTVFALVEKLMF